MDQNPVVFDEKKKNEIYEILADYYLSAVKEEKISILDRKDISQQILNSIENAKSQDEAVKFIEELSKKYTFFLPVVLKLKSKVDLQKEDEIINKLASF